jgi:hypothetical protein
MPRFVLILAIPGLLLFGSQAQAQRGSPGAAAAQRTGWIFSLTEGKRKAQETGKPLMLVFRCDP